MMKFLVVYLMSRILMNAKRYVMRMQHVFHLNTGVKEILISTKAKEFVMPQQPARLRCPSQSRSIT